MSDFPNFERRVAEAVEPLPEVVRLRALISKHLPILRVLANVLEALSPLVLNREQARDAVRDFEKEVK
jgi:hypothetical protein